MNVLVCGGRDYCGGVLCLEQLPFTIDMLVHGGARGADKKAGRCATTRGIHEVIVPALWDYHKKKAGPIRNGAMLRLKIDYCVAFPGGSGTRNMIKQCESQNIPVWKPYN